MNTSNPAQVPQIQSYDQVIQELEGFYKHPLCCFFIQFVSAFTLGLPGAFQAALNIYISKYQKERLLVFLTEVAKLDCNLSLNDLEKEEYIHAAVLTERAILNTRSRDKIKRFAQLYANFLMGENFLSIASFEEDFSILDELSEREFQLLLLLKKHQTTAGKYNPDYWNNFDQEVEKMLKIPASEVNGCLARLSRTGLYKEFSGWMDNPRGELTPNFDSFICNFNYYIDYLKMTGKILLKNSSEGIQQCRRNMLWN